MFAPTTPNGGDMGSHYFPAHYLRHVLLPQGQVVGWCPGNYAGLPLFQFYFPLPFLLMAGLSLLIPLSVAFKLVSVLGTFLLPPCAYLGLRLAGVPFPGPALGALATLPFLFMEANSMWGGNIPSTLAGEFTFSIGFALAVLFLGTLRYTMESGRGRAWNGLLVATMGLCHGYALLWAGVTSLAELVATRRWWRRVGVLVAVHGLAILLMAFWLVPLLAYSPWTTAYSHVWMLLSWKEALPPILWPVAPIAVLTTLVVGGVCLARREPFPRALGMLWAGVATGVFLYLSARALHVVDIRFLPFAQLGLCLAAAGGLGLLLARLPTPEIWPLVAILTIPPWVQSGFPAIGEAAPTTGVAGAVRALGSYGGVTFIPSWITWNYSGFEAKTTWEVFREINDVLRGDFRAPRVVFEHSMEHEALGTVRAFESLPLFSGRSTLEGLYMQASPSAPFVFYVQSEVSREQSCPFPDYGCSRFNLDRGIEHLRMFNVSQLIARSAKLKEAAAGHPDLTREASIGDYEIYRIEGNDGRYAVPLRARPYLIVTPTWKELAYRWFRKTRGEEPIPVFAEAAGEEERRAFAAVVSDLPGEPAPPVALEPLPALEERMETDRIIVTGCRPGHPVLIRISYHPRWKATTGERVWLAAPSFMLVFPRGERVELVFGGDRPVTMGRALSVIGVATLLSALLGGTRLLRLAERSARPLAEARPIAQALDRVRWSGSWSLGQRRVALSLGLAVAVAIGAALALKARASDADNTYRMGQRIYDDDERPEGERLPAALPYFRAAQELAPLSSTAIHSTYYESVILYRLEDWAEAERAFQKLLDRFPEAAAAAESQYHVGLCRSRRGDVAGARAAWEATRQHYPGTPWATYAGERLAEVGRGSG